MSTDEPTVDSLPPRAKGPHAPLPEKKVPPVEPTPVTDEEDPRARAARRAAELREHSDVDSDETDKYYIDPKIIPDGWSYEWRRYTLLGKEDRSYNTELQRKGWEAVPASRHPELMPRDFDGAIIEVGGLVLMERPAEITQASYDREYRKARAQVGAKEAQIQGSPSGTGPRDNKGQSLVRLNKSYGPPAIPD